MMRLRNLVPLFLLVISWSLPSTPGEFCTCAALYKASGRGPSLLGQTFLGVNSSLKNYEKARNDFELLQRQFPHAPLDNLALKHCDKLKQCSERITKKEFFKL